MAAIDHMPRSSLYVGDLHPEVTEKDLTETFSRVGPLLSVHLCRDKFSGKSLCYAYVNFWLPCHAFTALKCLNHTILRGKSMRIMWYERDSIARQSGIGNLFVKNLAQSITSARLQKIFSNYGTILSCKVAEEDGISKGFGFVQFDSEDSAMAALYALHDTDLDGKKLYVSKFCKNSERRGAELCLTSLFVENLDEDITENLLRDKFSEHGEVSSAVIMKDEKGKSKGFGFVNFDSHEAAKKAREVLNGQLIGSKNLIVGRALKKAEQREHFKPLHGHNYADLFVKNLDASVDDKKLEELFSSYGKVISAKVIQSGGVSRGFGFVRFSCPDDAKKALISLTGADFEGRTLYVAVARPIDQRSSKLSNSYEKFPPQPLYTSNSQQPRCNFPCFSPPIPFNQLSPWQPTLCQHFVGPFNSYNLFQAQNFHGTYYALPMRLAALNGCGRERYLETSKDQKSPSGLQGKIVNRDGKELCKGSAAMKTTCMRSSPEIQKRRPGYAHLPLVQKLQPEYDSQGMLNSSTGYLRVHAGKAVQV